MIDSELNELRKRKTKRIILWTCGITATAAIITIFTILGLSGAQTSGGGWAGTSSLSILNFSRDRINPLNYILSLIKNINLI